MFTVALGRMVKLVVLTLVVFIAIYQLTFAGLRMYAFIDTNQKVESTLNTLIAHGQKSNGFVNTEVANFNELYNGLIEANGLNGKVADISFSPAIGTRLMNKGEPLTITMTPVYRIGTRVIGRGQPRVARGVTAQHIKP